MYEREAMWVASHLQGSEVKITKNLFFFSPPFAFLLLFLGRCELVDVIFTRSEMFSRDLTFNISNVLLRDRGGDQDSVFPNKASVHRSLKYVKHVVGVYFFI